MSQSTTERDRVTVFHSRPDFTEALRVALEESGFSTRTAQLADIHDGTLDLPAFVASHKPALIVYDLPSPYERHWNVVRLLKDTASLKGATWLLTTTDRRALEAAMGVCGVVQIIGEPYGVPEVVEAVRKALPAK